MKIERNNSKPLLEAWPAGYANGRFRLLPGVVLICAEGKPTLKIKEDALDSAATRPSARARKSR
jgi:hypothetical protein